jgi:phosphopantothenoylcysteine synthetase/decarboxylase
MLPEDFSLSFLARTVRPNGWVLELVQAAQAAGWEVGVVVTPQATKFVDLPVLEHLTGYPVRSEYKHLKEPAALPRADAIVVFPATFNPLNKWALDVSDTLAVGLLYEYTGLKRPIVAVPCMLTASGLDTYPAFSRSIEQLREYGVPVLARRRSLPEKNGLRSYERT